MVISPEPMVYWLLLMVNLPNSGTCSYFSIQIGLIILITTLASSNDFKSLGFLITTLLPVLLSNEVFSKIWAISPSSTKEWEWRENSNPFESKISFGSSKSLI